MNLRLQFKKNIGYLIFTLLLSVVGLCCSPDRAQASVGVTFSWKSDPAVELEGYRLYYGKKSRFARNQSGNERYDYFFDLSAMALCSTDRNSPGCERIDGSKVDCTDIESDNPQCIVKGLPSGLNYFAITAYSDTVESWYSVELAGVLDKNGNLISIKAVSADKLAHLDAVYNLLLEK